MIDFVDRVQSTPNRIQLTPVEGQENTYDYTKVGTVTVEGTNINRETLMAIQGFQSQSTVFNDDGSITETNGLGQVKTTVFNNDGSITETFSGTGIGAKTITKTTTFNADGSVSESVNEVIS